MAKKTEHICICIDGESYWWKSSRMDGNRWMVKHFDCCRSEYGILTAGPFNSVDSSMFQTQAESEGINFGTMYV